MLVNFNPSLSVNRYKINQKQQPAFGQVKVEEASKSAQKLAKWLLENVEQVDNINTKIRYANLDPNDALYAIKTTLNRLKNTDMEAYKDNLQGFQSVETSTLNYIRLHPKH